jgi:O-antigen ligase
VTSLAKLKRITGNAYQFFNYLSFAERYVYWEAGWRIFNISPIFGVGLGNAGFYFQKTLPSFGWYLPEVMDTYYRFTSVPNVKSMWVRLLAETGIVGFSSFLTWLLVVFKSSWPTRRESSLLLKTSGWFGVFVIIAYAIEGFSTDTFALPYLWISLGIVSAAAAISRNQVTEGKAEEASILGEMTP